MREISFVDPAADSFRAPDLSLQIGASTSQPHPAMTRERMTVSGKKEAARARS
jgi:hypothetical protein